MNGDKTGHYLTGPHLCALRVFTPDEVAAEPEGFVEMAAELLVRLVPLWRTYLEGL